MACMSNKRKCLTLSDKAKIIEEVALGAGVTQLAKRYGVSKATICKIKRLKTQILQRTRNSFGGLGNRKTLKNAKAPKMENCLYKWFLEQRENHVSISGETIKERAMMLNEKLKETENFTASDGWLQRFKRRYGIRLLSISGEKLSAQPQLVQPFKEKLMEKIKELDLNMEQIYNANESGLYWKMLPEKMYAASFEKSAPGRKPEKQRIVFLACTNASGSHKIKPLIIGKAKNPRSLKNFNIPVDYEYSKTACMADSIFLKWFHKSFVPQVKDFLKKQELPIKALLLVDNAPNHPPEQQLRSKDGSIFVMYMPPNVIPLIELMDQNVVKLTKLYYRKFLLSSVLSKNPENIAESLKEVTLREAVLNLHMAWNAVDEQTIQKCWNNLFCTSNEDEDKVLVNALLDVVNLLKIVNPNVLCTPDDINIWNEDKQPNDANNEEDTDSDDEDLPIVVRSDEDNVPVSVIREQLRSDDDVRVSAASDVVNLLKIVKPNVLCAPADNNVWNEDRQLNDAIKEEDTDSDYENLPIEVRSVVTDVQAIQVFNQALDWAEGKGVSYSDILVLHRLRAQALEDNAKCKFMQTEMADSFASN